MDSLAQTEQDLLKFLRRILTSVTLLVASPFLMLAFLFFLLEKPALWSLISLGVAVLLYTAAAVVYVVVRARLRALRQTAEWVGRVADSDILRPGP